MKDDKLHRPTAKSPANRLKTGKSRVVNTMSREEVLRLLSETGRGDWMHTERQKPTQHGESNLQRECVKWFRREHPDLALLLNSVPNGARVKRSQAQVLIAEGLTKGVADLELNVARGGFHGLKIEMKREYEDADGHRRKTYQEPEQRAWQAAVEAEGYRYEVVRTREEFVELITGYLG